ncbi:MAG: hypothetical protein AB7S41_19905 [Parvibaculaceae bacterium]
MINDDAGLPDSNDEPAKELEDRPAAPWLAEIDAALQREDAWRQRGRKVVQRYRDERDGGQSLSRINILWSNTEVLKAALFTRTPKPDIRRRFADQRAGDEVARTASEVIERAVAYCVDAYDIEGTIAAAVEDMLLPGRGVAFVAYEPEIEELGEYDPPGNGEGDGRNNGGSDGGEGEAGEGLSARITGQKLTADYVYWEDFCHGPARSWKDVPWVARRHALRKDEFEQKFPHAREEAGLAYALKSASDARQGGAEGERFVEVWEVWSKQGRERLYVGRGYRHVLQADPDPLRLQDFFPCPEPLTGVTTTDTLEPVPEFTQYQDQANELDAVATRISRLIGQMRWRGVYDATVDQDGSTLKALESADDGTLLPHDNFQMLREKGGIDGAIGFVPIERLYPIVAQLDRQRATLIQEIYEVTGISDIIRGATNPNETKGAQVLKAQFGSMRMQKRQMKVQKFIRDLYRLKAEIIAEHFTADILSEMTGIDLPSAEEQHRLKALAGSASALPGLAGAPPPPALPPQILRRANGANWDEVMALLASDRLRGYRVDIETDTTVLVDAEAEKQSRLEFMTAMKDLIGEAYAAMSAAPQMLPVMRELFLFGVRSFKPGRALEETFEAALDEMARNLPQLPPGAAGAGAGAAGAGAAGLGGVPGLAPAGVAGLTPANLPGLTPAAAGAAIRGLAALRDSERKAVKDRADTALAEAALQQRTAKDTREAALAAEELRLRAMGL